MWGIDDKAGTIAVNPWNSVAQAPVWTDVGRGNNGQPTFSGARVPDSRGTRTWLDHQTVQAAVGPWNPPPSVQSQWGLPPSQPGGWPLQQWGAAANSPNGTYAEQAKKNMVPIRGQTINGRYDQQPQAWGGIKIDQQTPWDTGSGPSLHNEQKAEWGTTAAVAAGSRWGGAAQWPPAPHAAASEWGHHRHDPTGTAHWTNVMQPHPTALVSSVVPGASWGQTQPPMSTGTEQYDPNPQTPGPWVAPQPAEMNNDMMWHDPNPKQKKVQRDTGTSVWGDPNAQQVEIRRWKDAEQEDYSHVPCAAPTGGDWTNIPVSSGPVSTNTSSPATATGWTDSQSVHAVNTINDGTDRWGNSQKAIGWGEPVKAVTDIQQGQNSELPLSGSTGSSTVDNSILESIRPSENSGLGHSALTQQIADQLRIAVNKGLIDVSLMKLQLPQAALIILNSILQKSQKWEQAQQEYAQLMRNMSNSSTNAAQKLEAERLAVEVQTLQNETMQLKSNLNDILMKVRPQMSVNGILPMPSDGQSRLNQWKQANNDGSSAEKVVSSASDGNVSALTAATGNLTLDDKVEWKRGKLDWSPPSGTCVVERTNTESGSNLEKEDISEKAPASKASVNNGPVSPKMDDGPQEFVPGKKWEWRDPNKVAEDPNATPGNCKPNPLLSSSSSNANFQITYGQTQGNLPSDNNTNKNPYMGWNGVPYNCEVYGHNRPTSNNGQHFTQRLPGGHAQPAGFSRSMSSPSQQHFHASRWILIQSHGQNEQQIQMLAQKLGKLVRFFTPPAGGAFWGLKFVEPAETIVERMKAEAPYLQPKIVSDVELERAVKLRGPLPINANSTAWLTLPGPGADVSASWAFPVIPGDIVQQHIFPNDDLTRPY